MTKKRMIPCKQGTCRALRRNLKFGRKQAGNTTPGNRSLINVLISDAQSPMVKQALKEAKQ